MSSAGRDDQHEPRSCTASGSRRSSTTTTRPGPAGTVMFAPPFRDPFNYDFDPLILDRHRRGRRGDAQRASSPRASRASTMRRGANYSTWWNGGLRTTAYFHNMIGLLTETIGNPTPMRDPVRARPPAAERRPAVSRSRRRSGTSASRSTTRSPPTGRCSTSRRATARTSSTTSTGWARTRIDTRQPGHLDDLPAAAAGGEGRDRASGAAAGAAATRAWRRAASRNTVPIAQYESLREAGVARSARLHPPADQPDFLTATKFVNALHQDRRRRASRDRGVHRRAASSIRPARTW